MKITIYSPCEALKPFISCYRMVEFDYLNTLNNSFKDYPRTALDMIFLFEGNLEIALADNTSFQLKNGSFLGHFKTVYQIKPPNSFKALNVRFKPNGVYPLTKIPLNLLADNAISLQDLMTDDVKQLEEKMGKQSTNQEKIEVLETYLLPLFQKSSLHYRLEYGVQFVEKHRGLVSVKTLSKAMNTNYKSVERWFQKHIGLSPKRFIEHTRFKNILSELEYQTNPDWMQIVEDYGFYDQTHFIKVFKNFTGLCPSDYITNRPFLTNNA